MPTSTQVGSHAIAIVRDSDARVELTIDATLFSEDVIFRACYAFTDRCHVGVERQAPGGLRVTFEVRNAPDLRWLVGEFRNELVNQRVRERIAQETRAIRELIVAQAFAEADFPDQQPTR